MNMPAEAATYMMLQGMSERIQHETIGAYQRALADGDYKGLFPHLDDYLSKTNSLQDSGIGPRNSLRIGQEIDPVKGLLLNSLYQLDKTSKGDPLAAMYGTLGGSGCKYNCHE